MKTTLYTTEGPIINVNGSNPDVTSIVFRVQLDKETGKPKKHGNDSVPNAVEKILGNNNELGCFVYLSKEQADELEFYTKSDQIYFILTPDYMPDATSIKSTTATKLEW